MVEQSEFQTSTEFGKNLIPRLRDSAFGDVFHTIPAETSNALCHSYVSYLCNFSGGKINSESDFSLELYLAMQD